MDLGHSKKEIAGFADGLKVCGGTEVKYSLASRFWLELSGWKEDGSIYR